MKRTLSQTINYIKEYGFTDEIKSDYSSDELSAISFILREIEETGSSPTLEALWSSDFETKPVSVDEFLDDDYYLGKIGKDVYPLWRKDLNNVLSPYSNKVEWIIKGSIGSGKTFVAVTAILYKIYYLLCLRDPQQFYGLASGSPIVFGLFNIYKYLAEATSYQYLITFLRDMSPYFRSFRPIPEGRSKGKRETDKSLLQLPKNISIALGSNAINVLGQNLYGGLCDETEFGKNKSVTSSEKSQIAELYHGVRTRMDSRFMQRGGDNPGLLCLVSSAADYEQFLVPHIEQKAGDPNTYISSYALYEVKGDKFKNSKRFKVVVGDKLHRSYIVEDDDKSEIRPDARVIEVPIEFKEAFRHDLDTSIRDIAGVETYGRSLFLPRRDLLLSCIDSSTKRNHPFSREEIALSIDDDLFLEDFFLKDEAIDIVDKTNSIYRPKFYPYADRFVHIDLAKNRDCAGIGMVCLGEMKDIKRFNIEGLPTVARDYTFFVDIMLRIRAAKGSEIDFSKIRRFIFFLLDTCRYNIVWISYDSYQSTDSIQIFKKENLQAKELSVDKKPGPYRALRSIIMEQRLDTYYYDPMFQEITKLEDHSSSNDNHRPLIDHPNNGSKDVADGLCGAINGALISKGVQISGTEASRISARAKEYMNNIAEVSRSIKNDNWISSDYSKINDLEKLFN